MSSSASSQKIKTNKKKIISEYLPSNLSSCQNTDSALLCAKGGVRQRGLVREQEGYKAASNTPGTPPAESHPLSESL